MEPQVSRVACPYCKEMILPEAIKCKECGSNLGRRWNPGQGMNWARNQPDRKVLGVAACLAYNFRVSPTLIRLAFVLLCFAGMLGVLLYLGLAAVLPAEPGKRSVFEAAVDALGAALDNFRNPPPPRLTRTAVAEPMTPTPADPGLTPPSMNNPNISNPVA